MQSHGLQLLLLLDRVAAERARDEALRLALLSANPGLARGLYPDAFGPEDAGEQAVAQTPEDFDDLDEGVALDLREAEYVRPDADDLDMLQHLLGQDTVTVRGAPGAPEGVTEEAAGFAPDDAEWT